MADISIFIPSLRGGGAERVMVTLANEFAEKGENVDLVLVNAVGPYVSQVSSKVRIVDLKLSRTILALPPLVKYLKKSRPMALLSALPHANILAVIAKQISNVNTRLVISERNTPSFDLGAMSPIAAYILKFSMQWTYPRADFITAVSRAVADDLAEVARIDRENITVIYNPIVSRTMIEASCKSPDHEWMDEKEISRVPVILAVGRLNTQKDFPTFIRALAKVRRYHNVRSIILGEGEHLDSLVELSKKLGVEKHIDFPGFVDNPFAYMRRCNVFVLSSLWEGLPGVLIQAMACGAQVVATNCLSGPSEILENGRWGQIIPVKDPDSMAQAIITAIYSPPTPDIDLRANDFDVESATLKYLEILKS